jgi:allantoin racemase
VHFVYLVIDDLNADESELARLTGRGQQIVGPNDRFEVVKIEIGPGHFYESSVGGALTVAGILHAVLGKANGADVVIIGCATDPALDAARGLTDAVVIGGGEASVAMTALLGRTFGIVTIAESAIPELRSIVRRAGAEGRCVGINSIETPFAEVDAHYQKTRDIAILRAKELRDRGADAIILGCMSFGFTPLAKDVSAALGIPVVDPVRAAVAAARAQQTLGAGVSATWVSRVEETGPLRTYLDQLAKASRDSGLTGWVPPGDVTGSVLLEERTNHHA